MNRSTQWSMVAILGFTVGIGSLVFLAVTGGRWNIGNVFYGSESPITLPFYILGFMGLAFGFISMVISVAGGSIDSN